MLSSTAAAIDYTTVSTDIAALTALYQSTNGPTTWARKWDVTTDPCNPTPWYGLTCELYQLANGNINYVVT